MISLWNHRILFIFATNQERMEFDRLGHFLKKRTNGLITPNERVLSMAYIRENRKNGKIVSYCLTACLERDARGKQVRKYTTWTAPADLTPTKAKRAAERAAAEWEDEIRKEYQEQKEAAANGRAYSLPPEKRWDDFAAFVNDTWLPLLIVFSRFPGYSPDQAPA